jgi:hypothetical protein
MLGSNTRLFRRISVDFRDDLAPAGHFYRFADRALDLSFVHEPVWQTYVDAGHPSIDPVAIFEGIRFERQLLRLAADRLGAWRYRSYNLDEPLSAD